LSYITSFLYFLQTFRRRRRFTKQFRWRYMQ